MQKQTITGKIRELRKKQNTGRIRNVDTSTRKDFFMRQMEAYKEKTRQLQELIESQDELARELELMEQEMDAQKELQREGLTLGDSMDQLEANIRGSLDQMTQGMRQGFAQVTEAFDGQMEQLQAGLQKLPTGSQGMDEAQLQKICDTVSGLEGKLDTVKSELSEKIHSENVKCYRNIQSLMEEMKEELKEVTLNREAAAKIRGPIGGVIALGVINLILLVALGLYELGIFQFLF